MLASFCVVQYYSSKLASFLPCQVAWSSQKQCPLQCNQCPVEDTLDRVLYDHAVSKVTLHRPLVSRLDSTDTVTWLFMFIATGLEPQITCQKKLFVQKQACDLCPKGEVPCQLSRADFIVKVTFRPQLNTPNTYRVIGKTYIFIPARISCLSVHIMSNMECMIDNTNVNIRGTI